MRSDKMPTRREGEASSNTAVCAAKIVKKTACGRWILILAHNDTQKNKIAKKTQHCRKRKSREHEERSEKAEAESRLCLGQSRTVDRADASQAATCGVCRGRRQQQAVFGSPVARCPAVQVTVPRGMSWKPGDWERFKTPKNLYHASISCRIDAAQGLSVVRYFSSSSETVRSTFGPLYVSQS